MTKDELFEAVKKLSPEDKMALFGFLGMTRIGYSHDPDCAPHLTGSTCICVPPASLLTQPKDVEVHFKETWEDRLAYAQARSAARERRGR